ncbi:Uncharacterised protein [Candidatus Ornithobacterium hominis]|uniref:Uncharacterized protein n=1 Tax=Candidatus Ornithobacterium hominis TaxID=2497989 RepID=A0A383U384_9FLAO|nr:hypothetical protein [Candidatus Ornithobacterium hominis]MCT7905255.1 hypothetical protein [Candidatus Ornithobacterium hominis]SZD74344.1 Uncharacterised protein [Candidatus Ornithobacterium hominis]
MTAKQGIDIVESIKLQMNDSERAKFEKLMSANTKNLNIKIERCLAKLSLKKNYNK